MLAHATTKLVARGLAKRRICIDNDEIDICYDNPDLESAVTALHSPKEVLGWCSRIELAGSQRIVEHLRFFLDDLEKTLDFRAAGGEIGVPHFTFDFRAAGGEIGVPDFTFDLRTTGGECTALLRTCGGL